MTSLLLRGKGRGEKSPADVISCYKTAFKVNVFEMTLLKPLLGRDRGGGRWREVEGGGHEPFRKYDQSGKVVSTAAGN